MLNREEAIKIINLNPYGEIDKEITDRQFEVILKGFNYLLQDDTNFLYVADEVGLGKTYIAMGIATLLRHFSSPKRRSKYKDVIIVPKRNLQYKWIKEINNFIEHNYKIKCNIVKSVLGKSVGDCSEKNIHNYLDLFNIDNPSYEVYRNSSFSIATTENLDWKTILEDRLKDEDLKEIFKEARKIFTGDDDIYLKRLFGYLLNISFPEIDLLIVDEAHHYKHGIGENVAYRNQVMSRLMGVKQDEDKIIFERFPELKDRIKTKAKKIIFLSATPIDNGLFEIKQQLDCFIPNHRFKNVENVNDEIKKNISSFMIRGLMNIKLKNEENNNGIVSRNMYRHEHRRGNVVKQFNASPQRIENDLHAMIIGLMQFNILKHLNTSNNKSFEIGMLAGFETFNIKQDDFEREYEETTSRTFNKSEDQDIIINMANSYFKEFKEHLPHPKQDNLIEVLFEGFKSSRKSLVFVRRIASVVELERKLTQKIENWQFSKIEHYVKKYSQLRTLKKAFDERYQIIEIEKIIMNLSERLFESYRKYLYQPEWDNDNPLSIIYEYLIILYNSDEDSSELDEFRQLIKNHIGLRIIKSKLKEKSYKLLREKIDIIKNKINSEGDTEGSDFKDPLQSYFFATYFSSRRYIEGFNFRKRSSTKDWYRFNLYHLKELIDDLNFDIQKLQIVFNEKDKTEARKMDYVNEILYEKLSEKSCDNDKIEVDQYFTRKTFLNQLLEGPVQTEFTEWVNKRWKNFDEEVKFFEDLDTLIEILQGIFRNGSGMLPSYVAESLDKENFENKFIEILTNDFPEIINEIKQVIIDYDKIIRTNFSDRSKVQRALYGQQPITGASGFHKRDISRVATQFRMPGFPYILITTDVLKEGEDLHLYCKDVYHYGIAWNPSDMEQRTGRIDRINSSCYFKLKESGKINFDNSLQVFYPYLSDTLEVNQVAKVFEKMNDFIETFYDISEKQEKQARVSTDDIIKKIPVQIKDLLMSKYDYNNFTGIINKSLSSLTQITNIGINEQKLSEKLRQVLGIIESEIGTFFVKPKIVDSSYLIIANINLSGRRAPLKISMIKGKMFGEIVYSIESIICKSTELRKRSERNEIRNRLTLKSLSLIENNDFIIVRKTLDLDTSKDELLNEMMNVMQVADNLEHEFTAGDLEEMLN